MRPDEPDQEAALGIVHEAERVIGHDRFGGAWIDRTSTRPVIGLALVEPTQADVDAIRTAASRARWPVEIRAARYSRAELIAMLERVNSGALPGGALLGLGWDARYSAVRAEFSRWDEDAVAWLRRHVPDDALLIVVHPGARWVAAPG
jgi:hypothetical protein